MSNKKLSYNVNAIVGKYIMPVTFHKPNDDDKLDTCRRNYVMMYIDYLNWDYDYRNYVNEIMPCINRHSDRYHAHYRKITLKKQFDRKYIRIFNDCKPFIYKHANSIYKLLQERYKPTSYMAFARILEFFY